MNAITNADKKTLAMLSEYERIRPSYEKLVEEVRYVIEEKLRSTIVRVADVFGRAKVPESLEKKLQRKHYKNALKEITDLAGVRVVCYYEHDLSTVNEIVLSEFDVHEHVDKTGDLGVDKMGYHGAHFIITLGDRYSGARYDGITDLKCEVQVRTVLQEAWALISHHLIYKDEASIPKRMQRDLNNVASLLEIAQGVFDSIREKREMYRGEIRRKEAVESDFLSQPIDYDTLVAYTEWKFPSLPLSEHWHARLLTDLNSDKYRTLNDIHQAVEIAKPAVEAYKKESPDWFKFGTDYLTKSLGFIDSDFRKRHPWGERTLEAFKRFGHLTKKSNINKIARKTRVAS